MSNTEFQLFLTASLRIKKNAFQFRLSLRSGKNEPSSSALLTFRAVVPDKSKSNARSRWPVGFITGDSPIRIGFEKQMFLY